MDNLALEKDIHSAGLIILGELQVTDNDPVPKEAQSILLLGPDEPNFWKILNIVSISQSPINNAAPQAISATIQPVDQISTGREYSCGILENI